MGQHIHSKSGGDTKLRGVAAKVTVSCHHPVIPQQAGEVDLEDLIKFTEGNTKSCT